MCIRDRLYDNRDLIGGLEFVEEPPVLRFFMGKLRAKSDWPENWPRSTARTSGKACKKISRSTGIKNKAGSTRPDLFLSLIHI